MKEVLNELLQFDLSDPERTLMKEYEKTVAFDSTIIELKKSEQQNEPQTSILIPTFPSKSNNTRKWVGGMVLVIGIIFAISVSTQQNNEVELIPEPVMIETAYATDTFILAQAEQSEMLLVEGGTFTTGIGDGKSAEQPEHEVTVGSFLIGKYEVTQELRGSIMESQSYKFPGRRRPVENVNWYESVEFCNKLSEK